MRIAITLGLAGLSVVFAPAAAQTRTVSGRGTGSLSVPTTTPIPLYQVQFNQSGRTVTLVFLGKNTALPFTLEGRVTDNASGTDLPVEITGGLRDNATRGSGRVVLSGSRLASVELKGTITQGAFNLTFRGDGTGGGGGDGEAGDNTGARPLNVASVGRGTYELGSRRAELSDVRVRLYEDGRAELSFDGQASVRGEGTWRRGAGGRADIALNEWDGRRTSGTAAVSFRGSMIDRINVNVPSQNARVEFFARQTDGGDGGGGGGDTGARPIDMTTRGRGTYEYLGRRSSLDEMRIRLRDDGRAELKFDGDREVDGKGTWRRGSGGRADIDITEWEGRRTSGNATVTYRGRDIERVGVNVSSQKARVEFSPGRTGGDGGGDNAQPVHTSFRGSGSLRERGRTYQLEEASIRLRDNGEAELKFDGERRTEGQGRWTADGSYARVTITEWDGRKAHGSGTITFTRNRPTQVNLTVQNRSITFRSTAQIQPR